jgi:hypothetical protein
MTLARSSTMPACQPIASGLDDVTSDHHHLDAARRQLMTAGTSADGIGQMNRAAKTRPLSASANDWPTSTVPLAVASETRGRC